MKTLVVYGHENPDQSNINKELIKSLNDLENVDVITLIEMYPNYEIDAKIEQNRLLQYDRIIVQFPMQWYATTAILKKYIDVILGFGFAFGPGGEKLKNKEWGVVATMGASKESFKPGENNEYFVEEILSPLRLLTKMTQMKFIGMELIFSANILAENAQKDFTVLIPHIKKYQQFIQTK